MTRDVVIELAPALCKSPDFDETHDERVRDERDEKICEPVGRNSDEKEKMLVENNIQPLAEEFLTVAENPSVR